MGAGEPIAPWWRRRGALLLALALFGLALAVYRLATVPALPNRDDNYWYLPTARQLVVAGSLDLAPLASWPEWQVQHYRRSELADGRVLNYFPLGPALCALPVVAVAEGLPARSGEPTGSATRPQQVPPADHHVTRQRLDALADLAADLWAALAVSLVFLLATSLARPGSEPAAAVPHSPLGGLAGPAALALVFAFATPQLPIHAGGYWSHNPGQTLLLAALLLVVADGGRHAAWSALPLALGYVCRPSGSLAIALVALYLLAFARRRLLPFLALLAACLAPFLWWSLATYASWLPPYYLQRRFQPRTFWEALAGHLVSPNRGLLVFAPVFAFALLGAGLVLAAWWRQRASRRAADPRVLDAGAAAPAPAASPPSAAASKSPGTLPARPHPLYLLLIALFLAQLLVAAFYRKWWGGGSFGPRLLADTFGVLCLLLAPAWSWIGQQTPRWRTTGRLLFALTVALGLAIAIRGAIAASVYDWNASPRPVDNKPARLWDWQDLQILR
jgi:hypothetical protein